VLGSDPSVSTRVSPNTNLSDNPNAPPLVRVAK